MSDSEIMSDFRSDDSFPIKSGSCPTKNRFWDKKNSRHKPLIKISNSGSYKNLGDENSKIHKYPNFWIENTPKDTLSYPGTKYF